MRIPAAALLAVLVAVGCQRDDPAPAGEGSGQTAPAVVTGEAGPGRAPGEASPADGLKVPVLELPTLDGTSYDLAAHRGKWVVVNYWATWCTPCLEEMPELSALASLREHIEVLGLAYEDIEPDAMRDFLERHPVTYPIAIVDTRAPPADFPAPRGLPMTWLIAPDGHLAGEFLGPVTAASLEQAIAEAGGPRPGEPAGSAGEGA